MNCKACYAAFPDGALFCPNCGASLRAPDPGLKTVTGLKTEVHVAQDRGLRLQPGKGFAGRYTIEKLLGEGGMGIVYAARDVNTGETIVLKLLHADLMTPGAMQRLRMEGVTSRKIRHPNVVAVYDVGEANGQPYLTMEYVPGITLRSWIIKTHRGGHETTLDTTLAIIGPVLSGLAEAHRIGIIHRDLKPENIMIAGEPGAQDFKLKILDFGIARAIDANAPSTTTSTGSGAIGTPLYIAPEQRMAPDTVGPPADVYSVSVMFYELLMGVPPQNIWEPPSEQRRDISRAIDAVIKKGLSTRARDRFQNADEFVKAIDAAITAKYPPANPYTEIASAATTRTTTPAPKTLDEVFREMSRQNAEFTAASSDPAARFKAASVWHDDFGNAFSAQVNGNHFVAAGFAHGAPQRIEGDFVNNEVRFTVVAAGITGNGFGTIDPGGRSFSFTIYVFGVANNTGRFRVN